MYKTMCKKLPEISPAFAAALTVAFVLYLGLFGFSAVRSRRQNYSFYSLLPADKVTELSGTVYKIKRIGTNACTFTGSGC